MKKLFSLSLLFVVFLVGCKDDEVKIDVKATITGATSGWLFDSFKINGVEAIDQILEACDKDNSFLFTTDGKYTVASNTTKCDPAEPAVIDSGNWSLNSDNTELTVTSSDSDGLSFVLKKLSVTSTNISGETSIKDDTSGIDVTVAITLKKK